MRWLITLPHGDDRRHRFRSVRHAGNHTNKNATLQVAFLLVEAAGIEPAPEALYRQFYILSTAI